MINRWTYKLILYDYITDKFFTVIIMVTAGNNFLIQSTAN